MISGNAYEEVYQILKHMSKLSVMKIPDNILNNIVKNRNPEFKVNIDKNNIFNQDNISSEALDVLCFISYNYWMDDSEREKIDRINLRIGEEKKKKYNPDNLFKNKEINKIS